MKQITLSALPLFLLAACGSFHVAPAATSGTAPVGQVVVEPGPDLDDAKREVLVEHAIPGQMRDALAASFPRGEGPTLRVTITEFRAGSFGPTRMAAHADVVGADGAILASADASSSTMMGSTTKKLRKVAQAVIDQVVSGVSG